MDSEFKDDEMVEGYEDSSSSNSLHTILDIDNCMIFMEAFDYEDPAVKTSLIGATRRGDVDSVRRLIELGRELNHKDNKGNTALHIAAKSGNVEIVRMLLKQPSIRFDVRNKLKQTPLHLGRNADVAAALLTAGCDVNALDWALCTPLHAVVTSGMSPLEKLEYIRVLLFHDAEVNTMNKYEDTPLCDLLDFFGDDPETLELFCMLIFYGAEVNELPDTIYFAFLLNRRCFEAAAHIAGFVEDLSTIAVMITEIDDIVEVYKFAGEFVDDNTSFTLLSQTVADPTSFATCWKVRHCGTYCVPLLESLVRNPSFSPDVFYAIVECDDFESSLRIHRPDVLYHIIKADMSQMDQENLFCTALTFQDYVYPEDLFCMLERHGFGELFEAFMRVNVQVEVTNAPRWPVSWLFEEKLFGRATTLLEISRNAVRKLLRVWSRDFLECYAVIRRLDIPQHLKDYIIMRRQF